jgi:hypothetical protein
LITALVVGLVFIAASLMAQTAEIPVPLAVIKDGNGKVFAPTYDGNTTLIHADGRVFKIHVNKNGPRTPMPNYVLYVKSGCKGDMYFLPDGVGLVDQPEALIVGPDEGGAYELYLPEPTGSTRKFYYSYLGDCQSGQSTEVTAYRMLRADPDPLAGFRGPSANFPDRFWTLEGGVKLSFP